MKNLFGIFIYTVAFTILLSINCFGANNNERLLILPFENLSDTNQFPVSTAMDEVIFKSLYNFIGIIPDLDVPDESEMRDPDLRENLQKSARLNDAKYVVSGDYTFRDDDGTEQIVITLKIWSYVKNDYLYNEVYTTELGLDFLDTVDLIIEDIIEQTLNIQMEIALIRFQDINVGSEEHSIYINRKKMTDITNSNYTESVRVLANQDYLIRIRNSTWDLVYQTNWAPEPGDVLDVDYDGTCSIIIEDIEFQRPDRNYILLLNDQLIIQDIGLDQMPSGMDYTFKMYVDQTNLYQSETVYLKSHDTVTFTPTETNTLVHRYYLCGGLGIEQFNAYTPTDADLNSDDNARPAFFGGLGFYIDLKSFIETEAQFGFKDLAYTISGSEYEVKHQWLPKISYGRYFVGNHFKSFLMAWKASFALSRYKISSIDPAGYGLDFGIGANIELQLTRTWWITFRPSLSLVIMLPNEQDSTSMRLNPPLSFSIQFGIRYNL